MGKPGRRGDVMMIEVNVEAFTPPYRGTGILTPNVDTAGYPESFPDGSIRATLAMAICDECGAMMLRRFSHNHHHRETPT